MKKSKPSQSLTYRDAGVNIDAGDNLVENIKPLARRTLRPGVLAGIGGFGALFKIPKKYKSPVLVSGTDGVGTKLKLAFELKRHDTVGIDLVAMSVNDILTLGAEPLFFLDYYACGQLNVKNATEVVKGIALGCEQAGCALIGGETAEMPGMYPQGEYDLAGFAVGVVEQSKIINGQHIRPGDVILGLASSGAHSNGYSLIRKIISTRQINLSTRLNGQTLKNLIMEPTRIYVKPVLALHKKIPLKGIAHITGGGLLENVPRVLSKGLAAKIDASRWPRPALFDWLQSQGAIADQEMFRVFNCGIGLIIVLAPEEAQRAQNFLTRAGEKVWRIGEIIRRRPGGAQTLIE